MSERKYLPTLSELIDRLSIVQLKEINDIIHDIDLTLAENNVILDSKAIRAIVVLSQMNLHIWHNESNYRKGIGEGNDLELTHGLNGIRNTAKKIDCLAAEFSDWEISWEE